MVEEAVIASGIEYTIVRPSVLFGDANDIRSSTTSHGCCVSCPCRGSRRRSLPVRPTHVEDIADLMVSLGSSGESVIRNAGGPDIYSLGELVPPDPRRRGSQGAGGQPAQTGHAPLIQVVNRLTADVTLHREELDALMDGLASCDGEPAGPRRLTDHLAALGRDFGASYESEVARNFSAEPLSTRPAGDRILHPTGSDGR